jgi:hypothetical protein
MESDGSIDIYYAPFEYINCRARIALVGITPGPTQMVNANNAARRELLLGRASPEALEAAKGSASFSGEPMRSNLIKQLDHWGVHDFLGIEDSSKLFGNASHFVHLTSLLRYPTFVGGKDYRGSPNMTKHAILREYLHRYFVQEVRELKSAIFLGLGPQVQRVLDELVDGGILDGDRVIGGLLHPSGNCTYRINYLVGTRNTPTPHATNPEPYDRGRVAFRHRFLRC